MPVWVTGHRFPSLGEARRFSKLSFLWHHEIIEDLELQPEFIFEHNGILICKYYADFRFKYHGEVIVEDVKGWQTDVFRLKQKMLAAFFPSVKLYLVRAS
jgi:hypothetical protein